MQDEESVAPWILLPDNLFKQIWDLVMLIFILYQSVVIPLKLSFDVQVHDTIDLVQDCCFFIDIILNFNLAHYEKGVLIGERKQIAINYLKSWFFIDLLATLPYNLLFKMFVDEADQDVGGVYDAP